MVTRFFLTFLSLCISFAAFSQSKYFYSGYIVKSNSDTIRGYIQDNSLGLNSKSIYFKTDSLGKQSQEYLPNEICAFFYEPNKYYYSKKLAENDNQPLFLKGLILSEVNLYKTLITPSHELYFIEKEDEIYILEQEKIKVTEKKLQVVDKYKQVLRYLFHDCSKTVEKINDLSFTENAFVKITVDYNQCKGNEIRDVSKTKTKIKIGMGVLAGINYSKIDLLYGTPYTDVNLDPSIQPAFGAYIDIEIFKRLTFGIQSYYTSNQSQTVHHYDPIGIPRYDEIDMHFDYIYFSGVFKYELSRSNIRPYLFAGPQYGYLLSYAINVDRTKGSLESSFTVPVEDLTDNNTGYIVGVGVSLAKTYLSNFKFELAYSSNYGTPDGVTSIINFQNIYFRLNYKLF